MIHIACNTRIFTNPCNHEIWLEALREVEQIVKQLEEQGATSITIRWVNEINEYTPCNQDRMMWYFRCYGRDAEGAAHVAKLGQAVRVQTIKSPLL